MTTLTLMLTLQLRPSRS